MKSFNGFKSNRDQNTSIPHEFFSEILPNINNLYELKTILYILWFIENNDLEYPFITIEQLKNDELYLSGLGSHKTDQLKHLHESIKQAVDDGILIDPNQENAITKIDCYFLNGPKGQEAIELLIKGVLKIEPGVDNSFRLTKVKPNIFQIYEENIGIITPVIANALIDLEKEYPINWIEEAMKEAIKSNIRKLRYIEAILKNWKEEGRYERTDRRRSQKNQEKYDPDKYIDGEYSDFIDH
jgi:DnaD/phage-associated family protein